MLESCRPLLLVRADCDLEHPYKLSSVTHQLSWVKQCHSGPPPSDGFLPGLPSVESGLVVLASLNSAPCLEGYTDVEYQHPCHRGFVFFVTGPCKLRALQLGSDVFVTGRDWDVRVLRARPLVKLLLDFLIFGHP